MWARSLTHCCPYSGNYHYTRFHLLVFLVSLILLFDEPYQWEYGTTNLAILTGISAASITISHLVTNKLLTRVNTQLLPFLTISLILIPPTRLPTDPMYAFNPYKHDFDHALSHNMSCNNNEVPPALYSNPTSAFAFHLSTHWLSTNTTSYPTSTSSPFAFSGDTRTTLPFILASITLPPATYHRRWVPTTDGEHVAVDCAFPAAGHDEIGDVYLLLHGLNGGSDEEYVKDFVLAGTRRGDTVCCLIARGLMATPVVSGRMFNGARIDDVHKVAGAIKGGMGEEQKLVGVGYSMGAIVLSNYVARIGDECAMDAAIGIGGGIDMKWNFINHRSRWLWQPLLARTLLDSLIMRFVPNHLQNAIESKIITKAQLDATLAASDVTTIDEHMITPYNGFSTVLDYYTAMSSVAHMHQVAIPLAMVGAADDPLVCEKAQVGDPEKVVGSNGGGKVFLLLTEKGGHVGFPTGYNIGETKWQWMTEVVHSFVDSVKVAEGKAE